jgi:hypothetical protein
MCLTANWNDEWVRSASKTPVSGSVVTAIAISSFIASRGRHSQVVCLVPRTGGAEGDTGCPLAPGTFVVETRTRSRRRTT